MSDLQKITLGGQFHFSGVFLFLKLATICLFPPLDPDRAHTACSMACSPDAWIIPLRCGP